MKKIVLTGVGILVGIFGTSCVVAKKVVDAEDDAETKNKAKGSNERMQYDAYLLSRASLDLTASTDIKKGGNLRVGPGILVNGINAPLVQAPVTPATAPNVSSAGAAPAGVVVTEPVAAPQNVAPGVPANPVVTG